MNCSLTPKLGKKGKFNPDPRPSTFTLCIAKLVTFCERLVINGRYLFTATLLKVVGLVGYNFTCLVKKCSFYMKIYLDPLNGRGFGCPYIRITPFGDQFFLFHLIFIFESICMYRMYPMCSPSLGVVSVPPSVVKCDPNYYLFPLSVPGEGEGEGEEPPPPS